MQSPAPSEYFPNIKFNYSFYTTGDTKVTLEYVNNNFLKCTGYAYSRAISTSFSGIIYALGGIETTNITATGTITANLFSGSGASLTSLNASNISTGTLSVARGGTGSSTLPLLEVLLGNGIDPIYSTPLLTWDQITDSLNGKFQGSGLGLSSLDANSIINGTVAVDFGGTGVNSFIADRLLIGGATAITQSGNLTWNGTTNILTALNIAGNGSRLTNLNVSNATDGTLTVARGGTGTTTFTAGRLLIGNGASAITEDPELTWNGTTNILTITGTAAITTVNATTGNITTVNATTGNITTLSSTNIGIGITNPTTSSIEIVRPVTTATDLINMRYDATNGLRFQQAYVAVNDVKYNIIQKSNNVDTNALTFYKNNIGIGTTAPLVTTNTTRVHIYNAVKSSILLDTTTTGTAEIEFRRGTEFDIQQDFRFINDTDSTLKLQYQNNQAAYADTLAQLMWVLPNVTSGLMSVKNWKNTEYVGNVGIGKTFDTTLKLDVLGDAKISGTTTVGTLSATNIGIGITNPTSFEIVRNVTTASDLINMRYDATNGLRINQAYVAANDVKQIFIQKNNNVDSNALTFYKGNVGIGKTDPGTYKLNVTGNIRASTDISCNTLYAVTNITSQANAFINNVLGFSALYNGGGANFACNKINLYNYLIDSQYGFGVSGATLDYFTNAYHRWWYGTVAGAANSGFGNIGMTLNNNNLIVGGYLNIGSYIVCPSYIISRSSYDAIILADSGGMYMRFGDFNTGNSTYLEISASGGVTNINSNSNRSIYFRAGGFTWIFSAGGPSYNAYSSTTWTAGCDHRIKENIKKANIKICYDNVKNINLYRYNYKEGYKKGTQHDKTQLGFIAQQVKQHFPKSVSRDKTRFDDKREIPDFASVNVDQINYSLFGAVKQLIRVVEKQSKRIKKLEEMLGIVDDDEVEDDTDEPYIKINCEDEVDIDTIAPSEPEGV